MLTQMKKNDIINHYVREIKNDAQYDKQLMYYNVMSVTKIKSHGQITGAVS